MTCCVDNAQRRAQSRHDEKYIPLLLRGRQTDTICCRHKQEDREVIICNVSTTMPVSLAVSVYRQDYRRGLHTRLLSLANNRLADLPVGPSVGWFVVVPLTKLL